MPLLTGQVFFSALWLALGIVSRNIHTPALLGYRAVGYTLTSNGDISCSPSARETGMHRRENRSDFLPIIKWRNLHGIMSKREEFFFLKETFYQKSFSLVRLLCTPIFDSPDPSNWTKLIGQPKGRSPGHDRNSFEKIAPNCSGAPP